MSTPEAMNPARPPVGRGGAPWAALLAVLLLAGLGVVGMQEALARSGAVDAESWMTSGLARTDGLSTETWIGVTGAVVALVGLLLVVAALRPRPSRTLALRAQTGVTIGHRDLARVAASVLEGLDGASDVEVTASRRRLDARVTTIADRDTNASIEQDAHTRLTPVLEAVEASPRLRIVVRNEEFS